MLNDYAQRIEKLVVELLTKSKAAVFGLFKGLFDDNAQGCVAQKAQILAKYTAFWQVQGIRIGYFLIVHTTVFRGGEIMDVLQVIA